MPESHWPWHFQSGLDLASVGWLGIEIGPCASRRSPWDYDRAPNDERGVDNHERAAGYEQRETRRKVMYIHTWKCERRRDKDKRRRQHRARFVGITSMDDRLAEPTIVQMTLLSRTFGHKRTRRVLQQCLAIYLKKPVAVSASQMLAQQMHDHDCVIRMQCLASCRRPRERTPSNRVPNF